MNALRAKTLGLAAAAALLFCAGGVSAMVSPAQRLADYRAEIALGDPEASAAFLADAEALTLAAAAPDGEALRAEAEAVKDLRDLLSLPWDDAKANKLSEALAVRVAAGRPLCAVGAGPEPEKVLAWVDRYRKDYPQGKRKALEKAVRKWDVIFGTATSVQNMEWGQATWMNGSDVNLTRANWEKMTLAKRNAVLLKLALQDETFLPYSDKAAELRRDQDSCKADISAAREKLSPAQQAELDRLATLKGLSPEQRLNEQLSKLGEFFDNGSVNVDPELRARITAARGSAPAEVLRPEQMSVLAGMLGTAIPKELAGTKAGDRALASGPLRVEVRSCGSGYSAYDPATGRIALDSETIQQFMRMKGYTADSVMRSPEQVAEIAKYMSPAVVYESAHKAQADRAAGRYKPHVQEDEVEAMSLEALYTNEKLASDASFKSLLDSGRDYSSYASKRLALATRYSKTGAKGFSATVRQLYASGLPSLDGAAAQARAAIAAELSRRASLPAAETAEIDANGLTLQEALEMSPDELAGSARDVRTPVLLKLQRDLADMDFYRGGYKAAEEETRGALTAAKTGPAPSAPPAL